MKKYRHLAYRLGLMHFEDPGLLLLGTPPIIVIEDPGPDKGIKVHVFTADRTNSRLVYQGPAQRGWYQNDVVNYTFELDGWIHEMQMA
ncbi:MAG: hypothetical protein KBC95_03555 [Candidatus Peribacteraceae bacterium]|nr:hypothetical protein [Candidatus Peribacteraceae bacterium]